MRHRLVLGALAAVTLAAGCGGKDDPSRGVPGAEAPDPGREVVGAFVAAAAEGDDETMWELLSGPSRERYGPSADDFGAGEARRLARTLAPFAKGELPVQVSENIDGQFGVVALTRGGVAWATPLRREGDLWRIELPGPLRITVTGPPPGSRGKFVRQISVELSGLAGDGATVLYLDGITLESRAYTGPGTATVYANFATGVEPGLHTAVAFASGGEEAAARAWTFFP